MNANPCDRCGRSPVVGRDVALKNGRLIHQGLCADCLAAQVRGRLAGAGAAALTVLAAGLGAAFLSSRQERKESGRESNAARPGGSTLGKFKTPMLNSFSRDLTSLAAAGKLDPVIGRNAEIERVVRILARRTKNNPVLIGEAGVGKTAIVEGLALRIAAGDVPRSLVGRRVVALSLAGVVAGTKYRGEFEARLNRVLEELRRVPEDVILFIDELHTIVGTGSAEGSTVDAANMLKPALARGDLHCIGATTFDDYRRHIENDAALERRFQPVVVEEPSLDQAIEMARGLRSRYEAHHGVQITDGAIVSAVRLSARYISDRRLPDKAFDVLDETAAMVALRGGKDVTQADVAGVVSASTGIPIETIEEAEAQKLLRFEDLLHVRIVGQETAVRAVAECVRRSRAGLKEHRGPLGALLFVGPSGVGKTELARAVAEVLFGTDEALLRFDMSEFSQPHSASRLVGSPPGYAGHERAGELTEAVRRRPYSVILFDEADKADESVVQLLLQVLDDGRLTDAQARQIDFRNALVILTAHAAEGEDLGSVGALFPAELLNRLDEVVIFHALGRRELNQVARLQTSPLVQAARDQGLELSISEAAIQAIVDEADDTRQGARIIRRIIERRLRTPLAKAMLANEFGGAQHVIADAGADGTIGLRPA